MAIAAMAFAAGCGGGSSSSNVVSVLVSPNSSFVIVTQSITLTAIVTGSTNTNVTWACAYATSFVDSSGKKQTGTSTPCSSDTGNIPANSTNTTVVFTAPQVVPDLTKLAGTNCTSVQQTACALIISVTATSVADTKKSNSASLVLDSGISVTLTPTTATIPTSSSSSKLSQFQFSATLTNDIGTTKGVTWLVTQATPTSSINYPQLATCSPTCGTIDDNGLYSAPTAVPTTATVTLVVTSKADATRFTIGTITIIAGGPITFTGISPTIVPQGVAFYDIYLEAPGVTSASQVTITPDHGPAVADSVYFRPTEGIVSHSDQRSACACLYGRATSPDRLEYTGRGQLHCFSYRSLSARKPTGTWPLPVQRSSGSRYDSSLVARQPRAKRAVQRTGHDCKRWLLRGEWRFCPGGS